MMGFSTLQSWVQKNASSLGAKVSAQSDHRTVDLVQEAK
jgi:hypothetical protein